MNIRNALRVVNEEGLRGLIARLRRNERDFDERLAARLPTVADPDMPASDPLYQRLLHVRKGLDLQRNEAEQELASRARR